MQIIILGTGGFAVPSFEKILTSNHHVVAVVTMPVRGRGRKSVSTPIRELAKERGLLILEPENVNDASFVPELRKIGADLLFVCDYGKILSPEVITTAKFGGINLHGSLLPKYRGAAPINHALLNGEPSVGVSVIHITPELDAGPIVAQSEPVEVLETDTAIEIEAKLAEIGSHLVMEVIESLENGTLNSLEQSEKLVTKAPKLKKSDGNIDWTRSAREIFWQYQALQPWPKLFTVLHRSGSSAPLHTIPDKIRVKTDLAVSGEPGEIILVEKDRLIVATGNGLVQIMAIQPAGKKMMDVASFLRGYPTQKGDRFSNLRK